MYDVAALGELLIDFTCLSTDADGYPTMAAHPGGAPANYLAALTKFGAKTAMIGKVGSDAFGRLLIKTLKGAGIDTRGMLVSDDVFTTLAFVTLDDSGDREFSFARKPGADTQLRFDELDLSVIDASKVLHFGTLSMANEPARDATYKAVEYAAGHGKLISFDPNLRKPLWDDLDEAKRQMLWGLRHADIVKISDGIPVRHCPGGGGEAYHRQLRRQARLRHLRCRGLLLQDEDGVRLRQGTQRHSREGHDRSGRYLRRFCDVRAAESGRCTGEADRGGT